jgi:phage tail-like protein
MADQYYPPVGFHFVVAFELVGVLPQDFRFQEVGGLNVEMEMEAVKEGGNNRFTYQLPVRTKYEDITLKRGMVIGSPLVEWFRLAMDNFIFLPTNLMISLLNESHVPLQSWYVVNAIPKKLSVSNFNAGENSIAIETLVLSYQYFKAIIP